MSCSSFVARADSLRTVMNCRACGKYIVKYLERESKLHVEAMLSYSISEGLAPC